MENLVKKVKQELATIKTNSLERKTRPTGMPKRYKFHKEITDNLNDVELRIAYLKGLIGKKGREGSIIANGVKF
jgi:hypothetical protein